MGMLRFYLDCQGKDKTAIADLADSLHWVLRFLHADANQKNARHRQVIVLPCGPSVSDGA